MIAWTQTSYIQCRPFVKKNIHRIPIAYLLHTYCIPIAYLLHTYCIPIAYLVYRVPLMGNPWPKRSRPKLSFRWWQRCGHLEVKDVASITWIWTFRSPFGPSQRHKKVRNSKTLRFFQVQFYIVFQNKKKITVMSKWTRPSSNWSKWPLPATLTARTNAR